MTDCLLWDGPHTSSGYAVRFAGGRYERVHRMAYAEHNGPIPAGFVVHHTCEVRGCINPEHLEALSRREHPHKHHRVDGRCPQGHRLTKETLYQRSDGKTECMPCMRARARKNRRGVCRACNREYVNIYNHMARVHRTND